MAAPSSNAPSRDAKRTPRRRGVAALRRGALSALLLLTLSAGCGPTILTIHATPATRRLAQAEEAGAAELAPYEYYFARENLRQAREAESAARWQDAIKYAEFAEEYAQRALNLARERRAPQ